MEKLGLLIDGVTETGKHEIKKARRWISWAYDRTYGSFIDSIYGFFIDVTSGFFIDKCYMWKRSHKSRKRTRGWISFITNIAFDDESYGKKAIRAGKRYNNMHHMDKDF